MPADRQTYSLDEIKDMLLGQVENVVYHYAPAVQESYQDKGKYFTLNPGRPDRSVGSFVVTLTGSKAGKWNDFATGQHGDILDLIALNLGCNLSDAVREARAYLGLQSASPEDLRRREDAARRAKAQRQEAMRREAEDRERYRRAAHALWLSGRESLRGTPVEFYLRDRRGIDLARIGRQPRALRYLEACRYKHMDRKTGEIIEGEFPAMVAIVNDAKGNAVACHRTWLAIGPDGRWDKAPVPKPKKVLAEYAGAWINIWTGIGPQGGKGVPLTQAPEGTVLHITEGIEDALSAVILMPEARVIAGISLSNLGELKLPPAVAEIVLIADQDEGAEARAALQRAIAAHRAAGRRVRLWQNQSGGKDLNDALRTALAAERGAA
jgi:hypothetical protein